jgi:hypothetical protein
VSQLFIEALTLTALGAVAGLASSSVGLQQIEWMARANGGFPFWIRYDLSPASVLYALALAVAAAVIMGVVPGLKATGRSLNLQELNGRTATRLGSLWTTLIVAQVAVAVAILPAAAYIAWHVVATELKGPAIPVDRFVVADMNLSDEAVDVARELVRRRLLALMGKLREEPGVTAVTFSSAVPGFGPDRRIEFQDEARRQDGRTPEVAAFSIDVALLGTYGARLLAGRDFDGRDTAASTAVIVNRTFATQVLGGPPVAALGTRFRHTTRTEWLEIVGVVDDFPGFPERRDVRAPRRSRRCTNRLRRETCIRLSCRSVSRARFPQGFRNTYEKLAQRSILRCRCGASFRCRTSTRSSAPSGG